MVEDTYPRRQAVRCLVGGVMRKESLILVTCSTDLTIKLWDTANEYKNIRTLHGHDHSISTVRFTQDGERLVSASRDKTIRVWEVSSGYVASLFSSTIFSFFLPLSTGLPRFSLPSRPTIPHETHGSHARLVLMVDTASKPSQATRNGSEK